MEQPKTLMICFYRRLNGKGKISCTVVTALLSPVTTQGICPQVGVLVIMGQGFDIVSSGKFPAPKRKITPTDNYIVVSCIRIAVSFLIQEEQNTLAAKRLWPPPNGCRWQFSGKAVPVSSPISNRGIIAGAVSVQVQICSQKIPGTGRVCLARLHFKSNL